MADREMNKSFFYALRGLVYAIRTERHMKLHLLIALIAVTCGYLARFAVSDWLVLVFAIFLVLITETLNTAIEINVDLVTKKKRPRAMLAKDVAAAAVFLSAVNAVVVGLLLFARKLF